jgi:hypothetical protein
VASTAPAAQVPCRLSLIKARDEPVAVILRRGPTRWFHVIRWHTVKDTFEHGAWFRGRLYEDRCDLSPNGELLLYFAHKGPGRDPLYRDSWTAVSRAPWLHALALWPEGGTWGGGGRFRGNREVVLWTSRATRPHPDHKPQGLKVAVGHPSPSEVRAGAERWPRRGDWQRTDHDGNAIRMAGGAVYRTRRGRETLVADLNGLAPDPQAAPPWARTPLTGGYVRAPRRRR